MKPLAVVFLALGATLLAQESVPSTRPARLSRAEMEADLAFLETTIRYDWSYLEDKEKHFGVDLAALVASALRRVSESGTKAEFHAIVLELVAALKDGHAGVFTPGVAQPSRRWPFRVEETPEGFVVVESPNDRALIGEFAVEVTGPEYGEMSIEDAVTLMERTTIASTPGARRRAAVRRLHQTDSRIVTVGFLRRDGSKHSGSFETVSAEEAASKPNADAEPAWSVTPVTNGISRLRVRRFTVDDWAGWLEAKPESREAFLTDLRAKIDACFRECAGSRALVLDLRGNGGGTDLLGIHLAKHLLPKRFVYYGLSAKRDGKWSKPHGYEHDPFPAEQRFDGPLAILIDEGCFSVTDNFLRCIVENRPELIVVGRPTNGGTGAPRAIAKLPRSGTSVTLCTMRVYGPKGDLIEGRGTKPTIPVRWTAADFIEKRDPDLAAAIKALEKAESRPR